MTRKSLENREIMETWVEMTPCTASGRPGHRRRALYLCSPAAAFVTGATLVVDGGYLCR